MEIATKRDDSVCAGTVDHLDALIEAGFELIGEAPPDRRFVRYEWVRPEEHAPLIAAGRYAVVGDWVHITSNQLVHEHELAHAVHARAWPRANVFLQEGFAELLETKRALTPQLGWRSGVELDEVLEATAMKPVDYGDAWFLVSQIMFAHGIAGLTALWHAVPQGSSAQDVRSAYLALFDEPIDVLIEPYYLGEDALGEPVWADRRPCSLTLCPASSQPWAGEVWSAHGPSACEGDPHAVGPEWHHDSLGIGSVWRSYIIEFEGDAPDVATPSTPRDNERYDVIPTDGVGAILHPCWLNCAESLGGADVYPGQVWEDWRWFPGRFRVEVRHDLEDLPLDPPGELRIHQQR